MTMTLIPSTTIACARSLSVESPVAAMSVAAVSYAAAMTHVDVTHAADMGDHVIATAPAKTTNPWLGGAEQGKGSGSKFATKRFIPGCLEDTT